MSRIVDERVVEMRFDNRQFEDGIKDSMISLDKLKESLDMEGAAKSFSDIDKAANAVKLDGIASGVEALQKRFSTLGIVGMRVVENLTDGIMGAVGNAVGFVKNKIISGGLKRAQNIENAHFQLQALLKDEEAVQAVMDDAMASVDGTAYAYDEAAKAASQFAASGMRAGQDMRDSLVAITGVAAMTNSEYESISKIFTTVAGNGRLMGDQLLQLSSRGLNAAATIADYMREVGGVTDMTEKRVREMVSDSEISFDLFAKAMKWAFGDSAFRANETFTGALANMGSALARIGAGFFSPLIEQNSDLILLINTLRERINDVKSAVVFDEKKSAISGLAKETDITNEKLLKLFDTVENKGHVTYKQMNKLYSGGVKSFTALKDYINGVTDGSIRASYATKEAIKTMTDGEELSMKALKKLVKEGKIDAKMFTSAMEEAFGDQKTISKQFTDYFLDTAKSVSEYLKELDLTPALSGIMYIAETGKNLFKGLLSVLKPVKDALGESFSVSADGVLNALSKIEEFTAKMKLSEESSKNLKDAFKGLFDVGKLLGGIFKSIVTAIVPTQDSMGSLVDVILHLIGSFGRLLSSIVNWVSGSKALNFLGDSLLWVLSSVSNAVSKIVIGVKDLVDTVGELLKSNNIISSVGAGLEKAAKSISGFFSGNKNNGPNVIDKLTDSLSKFGQKSEETEKKTSPLTKLFEKMGSFTKKNKDSDTNLVDSLTDSLSKFGQKSEDVEKKASPVISILEKIGSFVKKFYSAVFDVLKRIWSVIGKIINSTIEEISERGIFAILDLLKDTLLVSILNNVKGLIKDLRGIVDNVRQTSKIGKKLTDSVTSVVSSANGGLMALKNTLKTYQSEIKAKILKTIAISVGLLTASIWALSKIPDIEHAITALGAVLSLIGALTISMKRLGTLDIENVGNIMGLSTGLIAFSIAILILSKALSSLIKNGEGVEELGPAFGVIVVLIAELGAVIYALSKTTVDAKKKMAVGAVSMIAFAGAVYILAKAINVVAGIDFVKGISGIVLVSGFIAAMAGLSKLIKAKTVVSFVELAASVALLTASLTLLMAPLTLLNVFDYSKGIISLGELFAMIAAFVKLTKGSDAAKSSLAIIEIGVALSIMVAPLALLGALPWTILLTGLGALALVLAEVGAAAFVFKKLDLMATIKSLSSAMLKFGIGMAAAAAATTLLSIAIATFAGSATLAALAVVEFIKVLIRGLGEIVATMGVTIYNTIKKLLSIVIDVMRDLAPSFAKNFFESILDIIAMAKQYVPEIIKELSSFIIKVIQDLDVELPAIVNEAVKLFVHFFAEIINALNQIDTTTMANGIDGIKLVLEMMIAMALLEKLGKAAIKGVLYFGVLVGEIALVMAAIGTVYSIIEQIGGDKVILAAGRLLVTLGGIIGEFVGTLIGSLVDSVMSKIPNLGTYLSDFMENLKGFLDGVERIKDMDFGGIKELAKAILILTAVDFINGLTKFQSVFGKKTSLKDFGKQMSDLGPYIKQFADSIDGISTESVEAAGHAVEMIATAYKKLPSSGGLASKIFGEKASLAEFGRELMLFGPAIKMYAIAVDGINAEAVEGSAAAIKILATAYKKLPNSGGLAAKIFGDNSLADFGQELVDFAPNIKDYAEEVKYINAESVEGSAAAIEILAVAAKKLPNSGGLAAFIMGDNDIAKFGKHLVKFGRSVVEYSDTINGKINQNAVMTSAMALSLIADAAAKIPKVGGIVEFFTGKHDVSVFDQIMTTFADAIVGYSDKVKNIDKAAVKVSAEALETIAEITTKLKNVDGKSMSNFTAELDKTGIKSVDSFANSFRNGDKKVSSAVSDFFGKATASAKGSGGMLNDTMSSLGSGVTDALSKGISSGSGDVNDTIEQLAKGMDKEMDLSGLTDSFNLKGSDLTKRLANGIKSNDKLISKTMEKTANTVDKSFMGTDIVDTMTKNGKYIMEGLEKGIKEYEPKPIKAIESTANNLNKRFRNVEQIKSPSRVFITYGKFIAEGLSLGIEEGSSLVLNSITKLAENVNQAFKSTVNLDELPITAAESLDHLVDVIEAANNRYIQLQYDNQQRQKKLDAEQAAYEAKREKEEEEREKKEKEREEKKKLEQKKNEYLEKKADYDKKIAEKEAELAKQKLTAAQKKKIQNEIKELKADRKKLKDDYNKEMREYYTEKKEAERQAQNEWAEQQAREETLKQEAIAWRRKLIEEGDTLLTTAKIGEDYWEKLLKYLQSGTKAYMYEGMEFLEFEEYILSETNKIISDVSNTLEQSKQKFIDSVDIYSEAKEQTSVSYEELMRNLEAQNSNIMKYNMLQAELIKRAGDSELIKEYFKQFGYDQTLQLEEFLKMSDDQWTAFWTKYNLMLENAAESAVITNKESVKTAEEALAELFGLPAGSIDFWDFTQQFDGSLRSIDNFVKAVQVKSATEINDAFYEMGKTAGEAVVKGMTDVFGGDLVGIVGDELIDGMTKIFGWVDGENAILTGEVGTNAAAGIANAIKKDKTNSVAAIMLSANIKSAFSNNLSQSQMMPIGANAAQGLAVGIQSKVNEIANAAIMAAITAVNAARSALMVASPSKVMIAVGEFFSIGFAKGITEKVGVIAKASDKAVDTGINAVSRLQEVISEIIDETENDYDPTIRPVMDLSSVEAGFQSISKMFNERFALNTYEQAMATAGSFNGRVAAKVDPGRIQNEGGSVGNSYQFVQNNYSPKALSRIEIYRDTRNLFSAMKGAVDKK